MDTESLKKSLLSKFVEVTQDRLQTIQLGVLELEKPSADAAADSVARELHTMKGEARMLGLAAVGQLAHASEDVLKATRDRRLEARVATDLLLQCCDAISDLLDNLEQAKTGTEESTALGQKMAAAAGTTLAPLKPAARTAPPPAPGPTVPRQPKMPVPVPPASAPIPRPPESSPSSVGLPSSQPSGIRPAPSVPDARGSEDGERRQQQERSIRVNVDVLDSLGLLAGDLMVESARAGLRSGEIESLFQRFSRMGESFVAISEDWGVELTNRAKLAQLENDLHLLRDDAFRFVRKNSDGLNALHGNLTQLADHVAEARLVPLSSMFEAFPRAAREMAHSQNKHIELNVAQTSAGVDRSMVADVRDAMIHLIRNAVDHGIEMPDTRSTLGKSETGTISLRARTDGDMLAVEVEDDGRGIDPQRILEAAVRKGLLTQTAAAMLSERETIELIFKPGFSTREEVGEFSGRGVGMDVVKKKIEGLGGSVSISSRIGRGSTISLRLPQSVALQRVLLIRLGDDVYGLPAADVESVARFKKEDRLELFGTLAVMHRGVPITFAAMGPLLGLNGGPRFERAPAVVLRHGSELAALVVDGFVDEREVAVKPIGGDFMKSAPFVAGSAALEDGRIAVLLHVPDLMGEVRKMTRTVVEQAGPKRLRVLLVDDSPIARATESALVRALGHSVEEAQDGEDGWSRLNSGTYDLIMTDVQMPKLDGFALTRRIKQSGFANIPIIILSSLASPEDKRRGVDAGADAYLVKGELGVESLALTIDRLT